MCSSHIYHKYFSADPFNRERGEEFVSKVLRPGGAVSPDVILHDLLHEEPNPKYLMQDFEILDGARDEQV